MSFTSWLRSIRSAGAPSAMDRTHRRRSLRAARPSFFRPALEDLEDRCTPSTNPALAQDFGALPLRFEANQGQADAAVQFLSRGSGYALWLNADEAVLNLPNPAVATAGDAEAPFADSGSTLRMRIVGGNPSAQGTALDQLVSRSNYFIGNDPSRWQTNVANYARVEYQEVYAGIDLVYYGDQRQLEYDFLVAPGADPGAITLAFAGADRMEIDAGGDLVLHTAAGEVRQHRPLLYQEVGGARREIAGGYVLHDGQVGFQTGAYDATVALVIDPVLSYSTYLGGLDYDVGTGIAVDAAGHIYVTGTTYSTDFPAAPTFGSGDDGDVYIAHVFVAKLAADGSSLLYSVYLGGSSLDEGGGIAVDSAGNAYLTGCTRSTNFPIANAVQPTHGGGQESDAFVAKLSPDGSQLVYSTYLGGSGKDGRTGIGRLDDYGSTAIAVDAAGNAYVTGMTRSTDFPTASPLQPEFGGGISDAFVSCLAPDGSRLLYSTFLGGSGAETGRGIAVDAAGNAYVTGMTSSPDLPTVGAFQPARGGSNNDLDAFLAKISAGGSALAYSTYLGGTRTDEGTGVAVDAAGNAYVTGYTDSLDFPVANALKGNNGGQNGGSSMDAFVAQLNPAGSALVYSTYLGGDGPDGATGITVDAGGAAYVTGMTGSYENFPLADPTQPAFAGGFEDPFVTVLNHDGSGPVYSTYLGGRRDDLSFDLALDAGGNIYLTGLTSSEDFPTRNPLDLADDYIIYGDVFVAKITGVVTGNHPPTTTGIPPFTFTDETPRVELDLRGYFDDAEDGAAGLTYTVSTYTNHGLISTIRVDDFDRLQLGFAPGMFGAADLTIRATDSGGLSAQATFTVSVQAAPKARFDWSVPERFGPDHLKLSYDPVSGVTRLTPGTDGIIDYRYDDAYLHPTTWRVNLDASTTTAGSSPVVSYRWDVAGAPLTTAGPTLAYDFPAQGHYPVTLTAIASDGQTSTVTQDVVVRDYLIVSIGDSIAAGEGNPDRPALYEPDIFGFPHLVAEPLWEDRRAHRSAEAGTARAALAIERADPHTSVTFLSVAASGAGILEGLLGPYDGIDPPTDAAHAALSPQLEQVATLVGTRAIDALLVSVGANDAGFGPILREGANPLSNVYENTELVDGFLDAVSNEETGLPHLYRRLNMAIAGLPGAVDHVYITEYPDPMRDASGGFVGLPGTLFGINADEARWASEFVLPRLNAAVETAARELGWQFVGGIAAQFREHGYPVDSSYDTSLRWIVRYEESLHYQDDESGTLHPNWYGQRVYAQRLAEEITPRLPPLFQSRPTVTPTGIAPVTVSEDAPPTVLDLRAFFDDAEDGAAGLTYTIQTNSNPGLFSAVSIAADTDQLTLAYAADASGMATLTVRATDSGGMFVEAPLRVTVLPVNDAPTFTAGASQHVTWLQVPRTVPRWATNLLAGPFDEVDQELTFVVSNDNNDLFAVQPHIDMMLTGDLLDDPILEGWLRYTPAAGAFGTATVTVLLRDNGGTANCGLDTSVAHRFDITVAPNLAELSIGVEASPDPVKLGEPLTYTATVTNLGNTTARDVFLFQILPAGAAFVSATASQGWTAYDAASDTVYVNLEVLAAEASATVTVIVRPAQEGTLVSTAQVGNADPVAFDPIPFNNRAVVTTQADPYFTDVAVGLGASPDPVKLGQPLTYTATVSNSGPDAAADVFLWQELPAGVEFVGASASQGSGAVFDAASSSVNVRLGTLAAGAIATMTVIVRPTEAGPLVSFAGAGNYDPASFDIIGFNNRAFVAIQAEPYFADVAVGLGASPDPVKLGQPLTYTATVSNSGPDAAADVFLWQELPAGVEFVGASASQGSGAVFDAASNSVNVRLGTLAAGAIATMTVIVRPTEAGPLVSFAGAGNYDPASFDIIGFNNRAFVAIQAEPAFADLTVALAASPDPVAPHQRVTYTATVANFGPDATGAARLVVTLPPGVVFVSATPSQGTISSGNRSGVVADLGALASGAGATLTIVVRTGQEGSLLTVANVSSSDPAVVDFNPFNNQAIVTTEVRPILADLAVALADSPDLVVVGQPLTYTATVTNRGPDAARPALLVLRLPDNVAFVSVRASQGDAQFSPRGEVSADLGALAAGASATVTVVGRPTRAGVLVSIVDVSNGQAGATDPEPANNRARQETTAYAAGASGLVVALADSPDPVVAGQLLTYTATLLNPSPSNSERTLLVLQLPRGVVFVSSHSSQGVDPRFARDEVSADLGTLAAGTSATLTVVVRPTRAGTFTSSAEASGATPGGFIRGRATQETIVRLGTSDLSVALADSPDPLVAGQLLTYTATVTNFGPDAAGPVLLVLHFPGDVAYVSADRSQGATPRFTNGKGPFGNEVSVDFGTLAVGAGATMTVVVRPTRAGAIVSTASVSSAIAGATDPEPANNQARQETTVYAAGTSILAVALTDSPDPVVVGELLTYTATVTNPNSFNADQTLLVLHLPAGVTYVSATASRGPDPRYIHGKGRGADDEVWAELGSLAPGASATLTVVVRPTRLGILTSSAEASSAGSNGPARGRATQETTVRRPDAIQLTAIVVSGIDGGWHAYLDRPVTFAIAVSNPRPNETYTYQFDWDGDGVFDESLGGQAASFTAVHVFGVAGTFSPHVRVLDAFGTSGEAVISPPIIVRPGQP